MVLEALVTPIKAEKHPLEMLFIGFVYSSIAVIISTTIFKDYAGLISVFLTVMASLPLMYSTIKYEEKKDLLNLDEFSLLKEHSRAISFLTFLFLGITLSFTLWYIFLPPSTAQDLFSIQIETIKSINSNPTPHAINSLAIFSKIILNNIKVLLFCIIFALFYGAGAIFILTWNASVIAVAIGNFIRNKIAAEAFALGLSNIGSYMHVFSLGLLRYLLHGIPEIIAYFIGGLAGGILSIAVIKKDFRLKRFEMILLDVADLILISIAFLVFGALIEVYITPLLFR